MNSDYQAIKIVEYMYSRDAYSKGLNIVRESIQTGCCTLSLVIEEEMLNGFGLAHGSITYALADSALAFASNSHGKKCLSIDTQISHLRPCKIGDKITARAIEISRSRKLGRYEVELTNQDNDMVAHFRGTVYVKSESWDIG